MSGAGTDAKAVKGPAKRIVGAVVFVVIMGALIGIATSSGSSSNSSSNQPSSASQSSSSSEPAKQPATHGLNQPADDGKFRFVATAFTCGQTYLVNVTWIEDGQTQGQWCWLSWVY